MISELERRIMEKKKKLYEPIRRGAPSLPFDFTEALKKIEAEYPYPKHYNPTIDYMNKLKDIIYNKNKS